jgi:hypothetical protein
MLFVCAPLARGGLHCSQKILIPSFRALTHQRLNSPALEMPLPNRFDSFGALPGLQYRAHSVALSIQEPTGISPDR